MTSILERKRERECERERYNMRVHPSYPTDIHLARIKLATFSVLS